MKNFKVGDYVKFTSPQFGEVRGVVVDVFEKEGKALIEPLYGINERSLEVPLVAADIESLVKTEIRPEYRISRR